MTLQDEELQAQLHERFVVGWNNILREDFVGNSEGYRSSHTAVGTTNGAGARNVQLVFMACDRTVLHVLPGFWHPEDLAVEMRFVDEVHRLWLRSDYSREQKDRMFAALHRAFMGRVPEAMDARCDWQGFDKFEEVMRAQKEPRDTLITGGDGKPVAIKTTWRVAHERMMLQPFKRLDEFDMEKFVDMGRAYYDNNAGLDKGKRFRKPGQSQ